MAGLTYAECVGAKSPVIAIKTSAPVFAQVVTIYMNSGLAFVFELYLYYPYSATSKIITEYVGNVS